MRLYLSGGGSGKQNLDAYNSYFRRIDKTKPILYIPLAMDEKKYDSCYEWFQKEISAFGFDHFKMVRSSKELAQCNLNDYNSLFIGGGNTYKLLKELQDNSNLEKIREYLNNKGIIYGGSAGAIIFGNSIDGCRYIDEWMDIDSRGLNMIKGYSLLCHYKKSSYKTNKEYLEAFSKKNKLFFLPEEAVLVVTDKNITIIGNHSYVLFKNGNSFFHNSSNFQRDINES